jgi:bifunctional DNA-binding transcriptional regulator/antitoxin component of YhaV-PrlF toxin-antitoxin module
MESFTSRLDQDVGFIIPTAMREEFSISHGDKVLLKLDGDKLYMVKKVYNFLSTNHVKAKIL